MNTRQIIIYATSCVNGNAQMEISFEQFTRNGEIHNFYQAIYIQGNKPEELSEMRVNGFVDYLFDNLWYCGPLDKRNELQESKCETYAELLFVYFQINLFDSCLTFDSFSYELIGK